MQIRTEPPEANSKRQNLWRIIFLSDTTAGRIFDGILILLISLSVITIMLESVPEWRTAHEHLFVSLEWYFTILFTLEYAARLWVVKLRWRYATSFYGIVDLLAILPAYIELLLPGTHYLMMLRVLRLMRMFRVLKMAEYIGEASLLMNALASSRRKILLFFAFMLALVFIEGTIIYVLEHDANPDFHTIPQGIYWAIVTITTVGYGDVAPVTVLGKMMASFIMLTGYAIIAVPTGIVTSELGREFRQSFTTTHPTEIPPSSPTPDRSCPQCQSQDHTPYARHCQHCGCRLI